MTMKKLLVILGIFAVSILAYAGVFENSGTTLGSSVTVTGGSINGTTVGASTPSTGAFTTLTASSTSTITGLLTANGGATVAGGNFTSRGISDTSTTTSLTTATGLITAAKPLLLSTGAAADQIRLAQTTAPTCTSNCGTGSITVVGTDTAGIVTLGTTGSPASGWVLTFNGTWPNSQPPSCVVQSALASMVVGKMPIAVVTTTTTMTVTTNGTAPANSDAYQYICIGLS
jgi:hypothetical protein